MTKLSFSKVSHEECDTEKAPTGMTPFIKFVSSMNISKVWEIENDY